MWHGSQSLAHSVEIRLRMAILSLLCNANLIDAAAPGHAAETIEGGLVSELAVDSLQAGPGDQPWAA